MVKHKKALKRSAIALGLAFLSFAIILIGFLLWVLTTTTGIKTVYQYWRHYQVLPFDVSIGQWEGSIIQGLNLKDIELTSVSYLPANASLRIQEASVALTTTHLKDLVLTIKNARLLLAKSDPIVIQATWKHDDLEANIFARTVDLSQIVQLLPMVKNKTLLSGFVSSADIQLSGDIKRLKIFGRLMVESITYKTTTVSQGPGTFHLVANIPDWFLTGEASMTDGKVLARRVTVNLMPSKVYFKGDPYNPALDIHGLSVVDKVNIDLGFKGTLKNPQMVVVSDPPLPEEVLVVMLATGRSLEKALASGKATTLKGELVSGFFDYLLLGGQGGDFARQYGLNNTTGSYEESSNKIGLTKKITDEVRVGVEIEKVPQGVYSKQQEIYSQKVAGEMDVTDHVSVNVSQKVLPQEQDKQGINTSTNPVDKNKAETEIYLKYQNRF